METNETSRGAAESGLPATPILVAFALGVLLGGANAVATRFTVEEMDPFWGAALRFAAAAIIFAIIGLIRRVILPRGRTLGGVLVYGLLNFGLSYALARILDATMGIRVEESEERGGLDLALHDEQGWVLSE